MKKIALSILLLTLSCFIFSGCEKDDICSSSEQTTPNLVVAFYNYDDQDIPNTKKVTAYALLDNQADPKEIVSNGGEIILPFRLDQQSVTWVLESSQTINNQVITLRDTLEFKYHINTTYLNKACGYISTFSLNQDGSSPVLNNTPGQQSGHWIRQYSTQTNEIVNQDEPHFKIFY